MDGRDRLPSFALAEQFRGLKLRVRCDQPQQLAADIARGSEDRRSNHEACPIRLIAFLCKLMHIHAYDGTKERRQRAIAGLIRDGGPSSQEELAERLSKLGFASPRRRFRATSSRSAPLRCDGPAAQLRAWRSGAERRPRAASQPASRLRPIDRHGGEPPRDQDSARIGTPHRSCARPIEPAGGCRHDLRRRHDLRGLRDSAVASELATKMRSASFAGQ